MVQRPDGAVEIHQPVLFPRLSPVLILWILGYYFLLISILVISEG